MKKALSSPRPAAFQIDSTVLFLLILGNPMFYGFPKVELNLISLGITKILFYVGCFIWLFLWKKKSLGPQSEKLEFWRKEKFRAGFWNSFGQTLIFCCILSFLVCSAQYEVFHLLSVKNYPSFLSLLIIYLSIHSIDACIGSFISWKITQRMMDVPVKQQKLTQSKVSTSEELIST